VEELMATVNKLPSGLFMAKHGDQESGPYLYFGDAADWVCARMHEDRENEENEDEEAD
jgi:hypothetical protein